jgi:twinkle protein
LSVDIDKGLFNCHNCGWAGTTKFEKKKEYIRPQNIKINLTDRVVKWFAERGISEPTLQHWKIGESLEYFPQVGKKRRAINFNYYRENNLVNVKYRDGQKNFKMVSGAELIFYGLDNIKTMEKIYIVEAKLTRCHFTKPVSIQFAAFQMARQKEINDWNI